MNTDGSSNMVRVNRGSRFSYVVGHYIGLNRTIICLCCSLKCNIFWTPAWKGIAIWYFCLLSHTHGSQVIRLHIQSLDCWSSGRGQGGNPQWSESLWAWEGPEPPVWYQLSRSQRCQTAARASVNELVSGLFSTVAVSRKDIESRIYM